MNQRSKILNYVNLNKMKLNTKKTKIMLFNPSQNIDFSPDLAINGEKLELVEEFKLLGIIIRSDLKWFSNTQSITTKCFKRIWMLKRLKTLGANEDDLLDVYCKQICPHTSVWITCLAWSNNQAGKHRYRKSSEICSKNYPTEQV